MTPDEARRRFAQARVARLATAGADGRPHLVPIVFAVAERSTDDVIYSVVDAKPKRTTPLRRTAPTTSTTITAGAREVVVIAGNVVAAPDPSAVVAAAGGSAADEVVPERNHAHAAATATHASNAAAMRNAQV